MDVEVLAGVMIVLVAVEIMFAKHSQERALIIVLQIAAALILLCAEILIVMEEKLVILVLMIVVALILLLLNVEMVIVMEEKLVILVLMIVEVVVKILFPLVSQVAIIKFVERAMAVEEYANPVHALWLGKFAKRVGA
jgi:hypothetical protein